MKFLAPFVLVLAAPLFGACGEDASSSSFEDSAAKGFALRGALADLVGHMADVEKGDSSTTLAELQAMYDEGDPSLAMAVSPSFAPVAQDALTGFAELIEGGVRGGLVGAEGFAPGEHGGVYGESSRGIDEGGLELRQILDKGYFAGGGHFHYAMQLTTGSVNAQTLDEIEALFGGHGGQGESIEDSADYAFDMGYHADAMAALDGARDALASGAALDASLGEFFRIWEEAMYARFLYYAGAALALVEESTEEESVVEAIHQLSEGVGLVAGFRGLQMPSSGPLASATRRAPDTLVDELLTALGVNLQDLGASTTGPLLLDVDAYREAVRSLEAPLMTTFELNGAEIEFWYAPSPG